MLPLASDDDLHGPIVKGLMTIPGIDCVRSIDVLPEGTPDTEVLACAADEGRVLVSNDHQTMIGHAWDRVRASDPMAGLIVTNLFRQSVGEIVEKIWTIAEIMAPEEVSDEAVLYLPY